MGLPWTTTRRITGTFPVLLRFSQVRKRENVSHTQVEQSLPGRVTEETYPSPELPRIVNGLWSHKVRDRLGTVLLGHSTHSNRDKMSTSVTSCLVNTLNWLQGSILPRPDPKSKFVPPSRPHSVG